MPPRAASQPTKGAATSTVSGPVAATVRIDPDNRIAFAQLSQTMIPAAPPAHRANGQKYAIGWGDHTCQVDEDRRKRRSDEKTADSCETAGLR